MAKNKIKNVVIVDKELTPTALANLNNKKTNLWGLIILFVLFAGIIFYLPEISAFLEPYLKNTVLQNPNVPNQNENPNHGESEKEEPVEYPYSNELVIGENNFELKAFDIVDNRLVFNVQNKNAVPLDLDNYNYFLQIYNNENTLLQRIKFDDLVVGANSNIDVNYELENSNVAYFTFYEIGIEEYPPYVQTQNLQKEATLTCRKGQRKINYLLLDNKLYEIEDLIEVPNTDPNYANLYTEYQSKVTVYNNIKGVNSTLMAESGVLKFSTYIDLNIEGTENINDITYPKDTDAKVMYFELLSKGYRCE